MLRKAKEFGEIHSEMSNKAGSSWGGRLLIFLAWSAAGITFIQTVFGHKLNLATANEFSYHTTQMFLYLALFGWGLTGVIAGRWLTIKRTMIIATVMYSMVIGWFAISLNKSRTNSEAASQNSNTVIITPEFYSKELELSSRGCDAGDAKSCGNLGYMYEHGYGVTIDYPRAISLYSKACDLKLATGCRRLGFMYMFGRSVAPNVFKEKTLFSKACDGGDADGCIALKNIEN